MPHPPDPIPALKQQLRQEILASVGKFSQFVAAGALGTDQPRMSDLRQGKLERFSLETLIRLLANIDRRVEISVVNATARAPRIFRFRERR